MKHKDQRYIQPQNTKEAMIIIQKLFNKYRNAPLTNELLEYHNNLIYRLQSDIKDAAIKENNLGQLKALNSMTDIMRNWTAARLNGKPFNGKMRHFKLVTDGGFKFERNIHKINQTTNHHSSRH
ncbi:hypothetical protein [Limosilactobacillus albertensis]|uniref:Transposase n=1 Tax=Limosilactobacillus albertensis TaxID=2759752 RepID=A0A839H0S0_9LACO|nr:hypothetical protein [Limosilactobacillus albertensis]MBB1123511.1 hypothetical protein [Limosilactobacillus albertensis]MCD7122717.1 hypothetical protein [Limosilactobacillus albertensis]